MRLKWSVSIFKLLLHKTLALFLLDHKLYRHYFSTLPKMDYHILEIFSVIDMEMKTFPVASVGIVLMF